MYARASGTFRFRGAEREVVQIFESVRGTRIISRRELSASRLPVPARVTVRIENSPGHAPSSRPTTPVWAGPHPHASLQRDTGRWVCRLELPARVEPGRAGVG
jgi:hypothetical protein